jgi:hypothetical protein
VAPSLLPGRHDSTTEHQPHALEATHVSKAVKPLHADCGGTATTDNELPYAGS